MKSGADDPGEAERYRGTLLRMGFLVLLVSLVCVGLSLWIGVSVVSGSRSVARQSIEEINRTVISRLAKLETEMVDLASSVRAIEQKQSSIEAEIGRWRADDRKEKMATRSDLVRFSAWVETEHDRVEKDLMQLKSRLEALEQAQSGGLKSGNSTGGADSGRQPAGSG